MAEVSFLSTIARGGLTAESMAYVALLSDMDSVLIPVVPDSTELLWLRVVIAVASVFSFLAMVLLVEEPSLFPLIDAVLSIDASLLFSIILLLILLLDRSLFMSVVLLLLV